MLHRKLWRATITTPVLAAAIDLDVDAVNPLGWRRSSPRDLGILIDGADDAAGWREVAAWAERVGPERLVVLMAGGTRRQRRRAERAHGVQVAALAPTDVCGSERRNRSSDGSQARSRQLQGLRAVIARGDLDRHQIHHHMAWALEVAARRVPVVPPAMPNLPGSPAGPVSGIAELDRIVAATTVADIDDDHARERIGVSLRRAAVATAGTVAAVAPEVRDAPLRRDDPAPGNHPLTPTSATGHGTAGFNQSTRYPARGETTRTAEVSVVMATNRPALLGDALRQIEAQTHPEIETVLAIHGTLDTRIRRDLEAAATQPLTIIEVGAEATLGEVLSRAVAASSGEIVTKMDDDDFYAAEHIADLLDALAYSSAQLVGKGSEFVYLAEIDTTIRRFPNGVETANRNLAGGTLMIRREDLAAAGGWRDLPKAVDQALIDDVVAAGGKFHRTHGLGFILNRHGTAHTWDASADYFLQQATAQWPGIARDAAGWPSI